MNVLKKVLIGIGVFVVILLIVAAFLPSEAKVDRSIVINAPDSIVFDYITNFENRTAWDPWLEMEPDAKVTLNEIKKGVGGGYAWEGKQLGSGYLEIKEIEQNKSVKSSISFYDPQSSDGIISWTLVPISNKTEVTWTFEGSMDYPIGRFFGLFMEDMLGPSLEKGLINIDHEIVKSQIQNINTSDTKE